MADAAHHGVLLMVRIQSALPYEEAQRRYRERMPEFRALPGLLQKYYLHDAASGSLMGVYLFDTKASMQEYVASERRTSIAATYEAVGEPRVEVAEVVDVLRADRT